MTVDIRQYPEYQRDLLRRGLLVPTGGEFHDHMAEVSSRREFLPIVLRIIQDHPHIFWFFRPHSASAQQTSRI